MTAVRQHDAKYTEVLTKQAYVTCIQLRHSQGRTRTQLLDGVPERVSGARLQASKRPRSQWQPQLSRPVTWVARGFQRQDSHQLSLCSTPCLLTREFRIIAFAFLLVPQHARLIASILLIQALWVRYATPTNTNLIHFPSTSSFGNLN